jgi:predicted transcriptional regulator of viral defense system
MNNTLPVLIVAAQIEATFKTLKDRVLTPARVIALIQDNLGQWRRSPDAPVSETESLVESGRLWTVRSDTANGVLDSLVQHKTIKKIALPFPYRTETRYVLGPVSHMELVQSLDHAGYFSHFSALYLNDLTEQVPKTIYFNVEQHASPGGGALTQDRIDRAFKVKPRVSSNVIEYDQVRIHRLSGGNTGQLGVLEIEREHPESPLRMTNIERTLIDATVRPVYSGGVAVVAKAFEMAAGQASVKTMANYLERLAYTYPYHQAIGFYLRRAGYDESDLRLLRGFPMEFDFYLSHDMKSTEYNKEWRLFVPKGF